MNTTEATMGASPDPPWAFAWGQYRVWAKTSRELTADLRVWRKIVVALVIGGAVLGLSAEQIPDWLRSPEILALVPKVLGAVAGIAMALAAFAKETKLTADRESHWIRARAAAEALKAEVYRFLARVPPYGGAEPVERLFASADAVGGTVEDLSAKPLTESERREGMPVGHLTVDEYIAARVDDQIRFYRDAAVRNHNTLSNGRKRAFYLGGAGAVLGVLAGVGVTGAGGWIAVVGSIGGAFAAYLYAGRHEYLEISYRVAAERLESLRERWRLSGNTESDTEERNGFILDCEAVLASQNESWFAEGLKRTEAGGRPTP